MTRRTNWFTVDPEGFRALHANRPPWQLAKELIANAWDEAITRCEVRLFGEPSLPGCVNLSVEDDSPQGFVDLSESRTFFKRNNKRRNPTVRGRFCLGDKEIIAVSKRAVIDSVTGNIGFEPDGNVVRRKPVRTKGTLVSLDMPWTRKQAADTAQWLRRFLPPQGVNYVVNFESIPYQEPNVVREATLETILEDEEGIDTFVLRKTRRKTVIHVHRLPLDFLPVSTGMLFELGIPVCELPDFPFLVDVQQKVPLAPNRDSVSPNYLRDIYAETLNAVAETLTSEQAAEAWVQEAMDDERIEPKAVGAILDKRYGKKRVTFDPSDREANKRAVSEGYTVVHGGSLPSTAWRKAREGGVTTPAGQKFPTPEPFTPDGRKLKLLESTERFGGDAVVAGAVTYMRHIAGEILGVQIEVVLADDSGWPNRAAFGRAHRLTINTHGLPDNWFRDLILINELLLHEFAHEYSLDHLSSAYHDAICKLGARMVNQALLLPAMFGLGR